MIAWSTAYIAGRPVLWHLYTTVHLVVFKAAFSTQLNSTQVYLKPVAERLKRYNAVQRTNNSKNTIKRTQYKNIQQSNVRKYLASDDHYSHQYTSIYSAVSDILFILLLIFSQGIVNKRSIFISLS